MSSPIPRKSLSQVLEEHVDRLMAIPGVVGVAESESEGLPCILVMVAVPPAQLKARVPSSLEGYAVRVEECGELRARQP